MKLAMAELEEWLGVLQDDYLTPSYPVMTIYDELLVECHEDDGETVEAVMSDVMDNVLVDKQTGRLECKVPIKSDGKIMTRWVKE
jgi:DNA polymerase I-like protein with 3'-5' exonuclease and polymerase domains